MIRLLPRAASTSSPGLASAMLSTPTGLRIRIPLATPRTTSCRICYNVFVNIHNNAVTQNSSIGDEVFSGTPAGAGGVTFCSGADYYKFNYNWVCGNLSTGDGGGLAHLGIQLQRRHRAQHDSLQPEHQSNHSNQRRRHHHHGRGAGRCRGRLRVHPSAAASPTLIALRASAMAPVPASSSTPT